MMNKFEGVVERLLPLKPIEIHAGKVVDTQYEEKTLINQYIIQHREILVKALQQTDKAATKIENERCAVIIENTTQDVKAFGITFLKDSKEATKELAQFVRASIRKGGE